MLCQLLTRLLLLALNHLCMLDSDAALVPYRGGVKRTSWHESFFAKLQQRTGSIALPILFRHPDDGDHPNVRVTGSGAAAPARRLPAGQGDPDLFGSGGTRKVNSGAGAAVNGSSEGANRFAQAGRALMMDSVVHPMRRAVATYRWGVQAAGSFFAF